MNTLEFATLALNTLRFIPDEDFNIDLCGVNKRCGCAIHWMFKIGALSPEHLDDGSPYWDTGTAAHRIYHLEGSEDDKELLRIILGFEPETEEWYDGRDWSQISKYMVIRELREFINAEAQRGGGEADAH